MCQGRDKNSQTEQLTNSLQIHGTFLAARTPVPARTLDVQPHSGPVTCGNHLALACRQGRREVARVCSLGHLSTPKMLKRDVRQAASRAESVRGASRVCELGSQTQNAKGHLLYY